MVLVVFLYVLYHSLTCASTVGSWHCKQVTPILACSMPAIRTFPRVHIGCMMRQVLPQNYAFRDTVNHPAGKQRDARTPSIAAQNNQMLPFSFMIFIEH